MSARSLTIAKRLPLAIIVPATVAAVLVGAIAYFSAGGALGTAADNLLLSAHAARGKALGTLFDTMTREV